MGVEEDRVEDLVGIFSVAADGDISVQADIRIHYAERNWVGRAVPVAHNLFCVKEIYPLFLSCIAAKGETFADGSEGFSDIFAQVTAEKAWLRGGIV